MIPDVTGLVLAAVGIAIISAVIRIVLSIRTTIPRGRKEPRPTETSLEPLVPTKPIARRRTDPARTFTIHESVDTTKCGRAYLFTSAANL